MAINTVTVTADKIKKRKKRAKLAKLLAIIILFILTSIFLVLKFVYSNGKFTVTLDPQTQLKTGLVMYDDLVDKRSVRRLYADELEFMDNISIKWIDHDKESKHKGGPHNGENFIAYTFYIENQGERTINYWYEVDIDDVIKNVDEAIRIEMILNDNRTVYGKLNADTKTEEEGTKKFYSDDIALLEERKSMKPNVIDKFTIIIWLEGDDPDCLNNLIGGEIKMHMDITEDHIKQEQNKEKSEK